MNVETFVAISLRVFINKNTFMTTIATGNKLLDPEKVLKEIKVESGMRVADFGCGNGYFSLTVAEIVGGKGQVYAVDILKSSLDTINREAQRHQLFNIKTVWSNLEIVGATKINPESLDLILIVHTLYQSGNRIDFLSEALRLLKPKGKIAIIDWIKRPTPIGPPVDDRISEDSARQVLEEVGGLTELEAFNPGQYHYALILEKN